ncbi:MAG: MFS transporter [Burkholderiales bacterium]|nr:MFS transporter [Burkholderiales bacterium]
MKTNMQKKLSNLFYIILGLPSTAMGFALCIQISALSWILSTKYGLKIDQIGLVWAAGPIAGILGQVIIGLVSDKVWLWKGRRRPFIIIGGVMCSLMLLALPNLDVISHALGLNGILGVAIVVALLLDLSINVSFNPTRSIIADVTPDGDERTKGYTWMQTISGTFGVLAYLIGALLDNYVLIYVGVGLVLVLSILPVLFIEEPRELANNRENIMASIQMKRSFGKIIMDIQPLWGFLLYALYGIIKRITGIENSNYYMEVFCLIITLFFIFHTLLQKESNKVGDEVGILGFKKILAAHSFTWIGVQTMFVYMFAYVQYKMPLLDNLKMGQIVSIAFLILNITGALLPVAVLEPLTRKIGSARTHALCILTMSISYALMVFFGTSPIMIYIVMAVIGIGWASTISLPFAIMTQKVGSNRIGLYMGLFNLSVVLPQLVASLGVGQLLANTVNKDLVFIVSAITLFISACLWMTIKDNNINANINYKTT